MADKDEMMDVATGNMHVARYFTARGFKMEGALIASCLVTLTIEIKELKKTLKNNGEQYHG